MACVKDAKGQPWEFHLTVAALRRIREATGRNLYNLWDRAGPGKPVLAVEVQFDDSLALELLYVACRKQAEERKVADVDAFLDLFGAGPEVAEACNVFRETLRLFFQTSGRGDLVEALDAAREQMTAAMGVVKAAAKIVKDAAGSSPAASASTPIPGPSGSSNG